MAALKPKAKPQPKKGAKAKTEATVSDREVKYPKLMVSGVEIPLDNTFVSREENQKLIGWEAEETEGQFGMEYELIDHYGKHVRLTANAGLNRELRKGTYLKRQNDFLNGRWLLNGETAIIGRTGVSLSLQHRGAGFELAWQMWEGWKDGEHSDEREAHYKELLPDGPVFQTLVAYGIEETPAVIRTLDYTDPRTEADVIYTSGLYSALGQKDRSVASKATAKAIRQIWRRTAHKHDPYDPTQTNAGTMDFLDRHPRLRDAVVHVVAENGDSGKIQDWVSLGDAAGLLYLMGATASDPEKYLSARSEEQVNWKYWKKAKEFWTALAASDAAVQALNKARRPVAGEPQAKDGGPSSIGYVFATGADSGGSEDEKYGVLIKAWNEFSEGNKITPSVVRLEYGDLVWRDDKTLGEFSLVDFPGCGGIDIPRGEVPDQPPNDADEPEAEEREEIEEVREEAHAEKVVKDKPKGGGTPAADILNQLAGFRGSELGKANPGAILLVRSSTDFRAYEDDAKALAGVLGLTKSTDKNGLLVAKFDPTDLETYLGQLHASGKAVLKAELDGKKNEWELALLQKRKPTPKAEPAAEPAPAPAAAPKPAANGQAGPKLRKRPVPLKGGIG